MALVTNFGTGKELLQERKNGAFNFRRFKGEPRQIQIGDYFSLWPKTGPSYPHTS